MRAYLSIEEIVAAARHADADAIYPGYGSLSENPDLAAACESAGITFVGPSVEVLSLAGSHIAAPFAGVVTLAVTEGDRVSAGATIATIEAMKMEAAITTVRGGLISRIAIAPVQQVEGGDLLAVVTVAEETSLE